MKSMKLLVLACAAAFAVGCGDVPAEAAVDGDDVSISSQELAGCTALCFTGSVTCPSAASNCSASNYQGVTCDGVFYACPTLPPPTCTHPTCTSVVGKACEVGASTPCCDTDGTVYFCGCTNQRRWECSL